MKLRFKKLIPICALALFVFAPAAYAQPSPNEGNETSSLSPAYRAANRAVSRILDSQSSGVTAGGSWGDSKAPIDKSPIDPRVIQTPYFEYGYTNFDLGDKPTAGVLIGIQHHYAFGYDVSFESGLLLGLGYERADRSFDDRGGVDQDLISDTGSAYASYPVFGNIYANVVGGFTDSRFSSPVLSYTGDGSFINPGLSASKAYGNLILNTSVSYLLTETDDTTVGGEAEWDQLIAEVGGRYNLTDRVYLGSKVQYNSIIDNNFIAGSGIDLQWWRYTGEVGMLLKSGVELNLGVDYDFSHSVYDNFFTSRLGVLYEF